MYHVLLAAQVYLVESLNDILLVGGQMISFQRGPQYSAGIFCPEEEIFQGIKYSIVSSTGCWFVSTCTLCVIYSE